MKKQRRPERRKARLVVIVVVTLAVVLLLLRMLVFINGAGRHGVRHEGSAVHVTEPGSDGALTGEGWPAPEAYLRG